MTGNSFKSDFIVLVLHVIFGAFLFLNLIYLKNCLLSQEFACLPSVSLSVFLSYQHSPPKLPWAENNQNSSSQGKNFQNLSIRSKTTYYPIKPDVYLFTAKEVGGTSNTGDGNKLQLSIDGGVQESLGFQ